MIQAFHTTKQVTETKIIPFTVDQLEELLFTKMPHAIYHGKWNEKKPFIIITQYKGNTFTMYCNGWADKTPKTFDADKLHSFLRIQGLEDCYIQF